MAKFPEIDVAKLRRTIADATPLPWIWVEPGWLASAKRGADGGGYDSVIWPGNNTDFEPDDSPAEQWRRAFGACGSTAELRAPQNGRLIRNAVNALPGLLDLLEAKERELAEAHRKLAAVRKECPLVEDCRYGDGFAEEE